MALPSAAGPGFRIQVLYKEGLQTWEYEHIAPEAATDYLAQLTRDYLTPDCADMLPFEIIRADKYLRQACRPAARPADRS